MYLVYIQGLLEPNSYLDLISICRNQFKTWHLATPVVLYSIVFNIPKFFEYKIICPAEYMRYRGKSYFTLCKLSLFRNNATSQINLFDDFSNFYKLNVYLLRNNLTGPGLNNRSMSDGDGDGMCGFSEKLLVINNSR